MPETIVFCYDCKKQLDEFYAIFECSELCPYCGSTNKYVELNISESIQISECLDLKVKESDIKKPTQEIRVGDDFYKKENKLVSKNRIIDRKNNAYYEKIEDKETKKIIHECSEKLTEHYGHGSAKMRNK